METIEIVVQGEELESIKIQLTSEEVTALYKLRKEKVVKIAEIEKKLNDAEKNITYLIKQKDIAEAEVLQANNLLTALGIAEKTNEEETFYRKQLSLVTRIALYVAYITAK